MVTESRGRKHPSIEMSPPPIMSHRRRSFSPSPEMGGYPGPYMDNLSDKSDGLGGHRTSLQPAVGGHIVMRRNSPNARSNSSRSIPPRRYFILYSEYGK